MTSTISEQSPLGIALQSGCSFSGQKFSPLQLSAANFIRRRCTGLTFSPEIDRILVVFRVSGRVANFDFEGIDRVRCSHIKRMIAMDFGVSKLTWERSTMTELQTSFGLALHQVVEEAIECAAKRRLSIPTAETVSCLKIAIDDWLDTCLT